MARESTRIFTNPELCEKAIFSGVLATSKISTLCPCWIAVLAQQIREEYIGTFASDLSEGSKCQLWLWSKINSLPVVCLYYCTSLACCYSKNRNDSSSLRNTMVNRTMQANFVLNSWRCSLRVPESHKFVRVKTQYNIHHHGLGTLSLLTVWKISLTSMIDQLKIKILSTETVSTITFEYPLKIGGCCIAL